ncbi:prepilin-type N-terminal cleavage/methylation domain-containing protein, partial [Pseudomonas carnis]
MNFQGAEPMKTRHRQGGFTLLEMLGVNALLGVFAPIVGGQGGGNVGKG